MWAERRGRRTPWRTLLICALGLTIIGCAPQDDEVEPIEALALSSPYVPPERTARRASVSSGSRAAHPVYAAGAQVDEEPLPPAPLRALQPSSRTGFAVPPPTLSDPDVPQVQVYRPPQRAAPVRTAESILMATLRGISEIAPLRVEDLEPTLAAAELFHVVGNGCALADVEPVADIGALTAVQRACMEVRIGSDSDPALRNRLSLALIANALTLEDASWVGLVQRHLEEIDPGNPSLALRLAMYEHGQGHAEAALDWSESALAHRADWPPTIYEDRTWQVYQVRAAAAQASWHALTAAGAPEADVEDARQRTAEAARDWMRYAHHVRRKGVGATRLCAEVGGC